MSDSNKTPILQPLYELCYRAHTGTSFSPERRAKDYVSSYSEMLEKDLIELGDNSGNYKEKFIEKFSMWMNSKSRCISSMITGGSNFPVRRAQKNNQYERNASDNFYLWRERYFSAVNRQPWKTPEDEIEIAELNLETLTLLQLEMKEINAEIRKLTKKKLTHREIISALLADGYSQEALKNVREDYSGKFKVPAWFLTNNNATIKRNAEKVKTMQARIETKSSWEDVTFEGGYLTIENDRVQIFHDEKPERSVIDEIKKNGFRWSPNWKCWTRKHTGQALRVAKSLSFITQLQAV